MRCKLKCFCEDTKLCDRSADQILMTDVKVLHLRIFPTLLVPTSLAKPYFLTCFLFLPDTSRREGSQEAFLVYINERKHRWVWFAQRGRDEEGTESACL